MVENLPKLMKGMSRAGLTPRWNEKLGLHLGNVCERTGGRGEEGEESS